MELSEINPYLRTSGYFPRWNYRNGVDSIAYDFRMFVFVHGTALTALRDRDLRMPPNSLLILAPGEPYNFQNEDDSHPFDLYCLSFDLTQEYRDSTRFLFPTFVPLFRPESLMDQKIRNGERDISCLCLPQILYDCPGVCEQVRQIYQLQRYRPPYYEERCSGLLKEVFFIALSENTKQESTAGIGPGGIAIAERTMRYIEEHFREPLNEQTIAAAMNFHPYYLARLTVRYFDITPYQYLIQCRTEAAVQLLLSTDRTIKDIAVSCGFVNPSHFSTVIRRKTGMSPAMIRRSTKGETR